MESVAADSPLRGERVRRVLRVAGAWGAGLTVAILAASVLLRLATRYGAGGEAVSMLPEAVEHAARLGHRFAAMGVAFVAALVVLVSAGERPVPRARSAAVGAALALTVALAVVGRYTPGYREAWATVANVSGGIALACAFWWLREHHAGGGTGAWRPLAWSALAALVALSAAGAATSAAAMRGDHAFGPLHLWVATLFLGLVLAAALRYRRDGLLAVAIAAVSVMQYGLGFVMLAAGASRPLTLAWIHALMACVLGLLLVSLASRGPRGDQASR